jgi:transposase
MSSRKQKESNAKSMLEPQRVMHPHAAGIDIHSNEHWVAVPPESALRPPADHPANLPGWVRKFGTCTADLEALADWLTACGVDTVAMESTGIYWVPLFELLEQRGFRVYLVNARQTRHAPGRPKTDVLDCQWIQRLHGYGLLTPSFRPEDEVVVLRGYLRQRQMLIEYASHHVLHMQKALEQMNVKLREVVNDITGLTGMAIIKAILKGQRDPQVLAKFRHKNCKRTREEIARALYGNWREEHLFVLEQALALYEFYRKRQEECDQRLANYLRRMADHSNGKSIGPSQRRPAGTRTNDPRFPARDLLFRFSGADLTVIEGVHANTALTLLAEIGRDMSKWPTAKHFVSWLGLCPQTHISGGKMKRRRIRRIAGRAGRALRMAAQSCHHAKNAMGAFYRRVQARAGAPKAIVATARKIAERIYRLLKHGAEYVQQEMNVYEEAYRKRLLKGLARRAKELGYQLTALPPATPDPITG